jgi:hypothetical protein
MPQRAQHRLFVNRNKISFYEKNYKVAILPQFTKIKPEKAFRRVNYFGPFLVIISFFHGCHQVRKTKLFAGYLKSGRYRGKGLNLLNLLA